MKDEIILKKAIDKAADNGFRIVDVGASPCVAYYKTTSRTFSEYFNSDKLIHLLADKEKKRAQKGYYINYYSVIFSHQFAKRFWGEFTVLYEEMGEVFPIYPIWQYHLKTMVNERNPIKYLEKFI